MVLHSSWNVTSGSLLLSRVLWEGRPTLAGQRKEGWRGGGSASHFTANIGSGRPPARPGPRCPGPRRRAWCAGCPPTWSAADSDCAGKACRLQGWQRWAKALSQVTAPLGLGPDERTWASLHHRAALYRVHITIQVMAYSGPTVQKRPVSVASRS